jgi:hypothetical protein
LELIKDYNLQVHYHLGKANVVADALSRKSHCNSLIEGDFHLSHLLHPAVLHNITAEGSLRSQIIKLQKTDVGVFHIRRKMKSKKLSIFESMRREFSGSMIDSWCQRTESSGIKSYLKPILLSCPSTLAVVRCTKT